MNHFEKYFAGENFQCLIGIGISVVSIGLAIYFLYIDKPLLKGVAYPFLVISFLLLVICSGVVWRTPKDVKRVTQFHQSAPNKLKTEELPRMEKVLTSFKILKRIEIVLGIAGILLLVMYRNHSLVMGIGIGLSIQAIIMLSFDLVAESRGLTYINYLRGLT